MPPIVNKLKKEIIIYCPLCSKDYQPQNLRTIDSAGHASLAHSRCPACKTAVLSLMYKDLLGITLIGMATDLDYEDVLKFKERQAVSHDDLLEIYSYFQ